MSAIRGIGRLLRTLFSPSVLPFAILIALSLISIVSRAWLIVRPLIASRPAG